MHPIPFGRRRFLKATGVSIALPWLESLSRSARAGAGTQPPFRMVCVGNEFGMVPGKFWPTAHGRDYESTPLLEPLRGLRSDYTVFSHLDHGLKGGHFAIHGFLTGIKSTEARHMADGRQPRSAGRGIRRQPDAVSVAGHRLGGRDPRRLHDELDPQRDSRIPPISGPRELFRLLFVDKTAERVPGRRCVVRRESILDAVMGDAAALQQRVWQARPRQIGGIPHLGAGRRDRDST